MKENNNINVLWYLIALTISNHFDRVKLLLNKYGYDPLNEEEAAVDISDMIGTFKWDMFIKEFGEIKLEESGWIDAVISAVGGIASASLNFASSKKQQQATKDNAKAQIITSLAQIKLERERIKTEIERNKQQAEKTKRFIIISLIISLAFIISLVFILFIRRKKTS
jgi:hypothetical protein